MKNLNLYVTNDVPREFSNQVLKFADAHERPWSFFASGGSLAPRLYRELSSKIEFSHSESPIEVFLGDERVLNPRSDESNAYNTSENLLATSNMQVGPFKLNAPLKMEEYNAVSRLFSGDVSTDYMLCSSLAEKYAEQIASAPQPWLIHLGMGADGHVASIFPNSPAFISADSSGALYVPNYDPSEANRHLRLTLTLHGIAQSQKVIITAVGKSKAQTIKQALEDDPLLPISHLRAPNISLIIDDEAASLLPLS